jgi:hypothetical protein
VHMCRCVANKCEQMFSLGSAYAFHSATFVHLGMHITCHMFTFVCICLCIYFFNYQFIFNKCKKKLDNILNNMIHWLNNNNLVIVL